MILLAADGPVKVLSCSSSYLFPTPIGNRDTPRKRENGFNRHHTERGLCFLKKKKKNPKPTKHHLQQKNGKSLKFFPAMNFHVLLASLHPHRLKTIKGKNDDASVTVLAKMSSISPKHNKIVHGQQNATAHSMTTSSLFSNVKKSQYVVFFL